MCKEKIVKLFFVVLSLCFILPVHQSYALMTKRDFCDLSFETQLDTREIEYRYVTELNKTQKITIEKANCISELIRRKSNQTVSEIIRAYQTLIFQPKKVQGMVRQVDNKNKLPDEAHLQAIYEHVSSLKEALAAEIKAYKDNTRRLTLQTKYEEARNKKTQKINRSKFSKAEEEELDELAKTASPFINMGQAGVEEREEKIRMIDAFMDELKSLIPSLAN